MVLSISLAFSLPTAAVTVQKRNLWLYTWDGYQEFWCTCLVVRQLGRKAFCVPAHSGPSFVCSDQQSLQSNRKKKFPLGLELLLFSWLFFPPSQADRFFFPTLPSQPISPTKLSAPPPNVSTAILQANILQQVLKLWFYENIWSVILRPSGNACSAQCCRQSPSQLSPQCRTPSHNLIQSTKQVHKFQFTLKSRFFCCCFLFRSLIHAAAACVHTVWQKLSACRWFCFCMLQKPLNRASGSAILSIVWEPSAWTRVPFLQSTDTS